MDQTSVIKTYNRLASTYDHLFSPIFNPGRKRVVDRMACQPSDRVLEVGVGTGMSLPYYPSDTRVSGIDLSENMLERARQRVAREQLRNVDLRIMDAQQLDYPDNYFDKVTAMYVASVVPDPARMVAEMKRVCRPGGDLFIVNHFSHSNGFVRTLENITSIVTPFFGFTSVFPLDKFLEAANYQHFEIEPVNLFGYWLLIHAENE